MKKENKKKMYKAGLVSLVFVGFVGAILIMTQVGNVIPEQEKVRSWHMVAEWTPLSPLFADADPGAGAGGILNIFMVNHSSVGNLTENTSATVEGWCDANDLGYCNADDSEVDIAHSTDFDFGIKVRANATQAKRAAVWFDTDVRVRVTSADLGLSADTVLTGHILQNNTNDDYIWMMFETKADDTNGFSISKDSTNEVTSIKFECYY